jgi:hypothetical protein
MEPEISRDAAGGACLLTVFLTFTYLFTFTFHTGTYNECNSYCNRNTFFFHMHTFISFVMYLHGKQNTFSNSVAGV